MGTYRIGRDCGLEPRERVLLVSQALAEERIVHRLFIERLLVVHTRAVLEERDLGLEVLALLLQ